MGRTSSITMPIMVEIVGRAGCRRKCVMFFVCFFLLRFGITKFVITETLWSSVIFKTTINTFCRTWNLSIATFSLLITWHSSSSKSAAAYKISWKSDDSPIFNFFYGPHGFSLRDKFIPKIAIFCDFWDRNPTFLKPKRWNLVWRCGPGTPSPKPNFIKIAEGGIPILGQICTKNYQFWRFWGL